jgi:hypothetical protein
MLSGARVETFERGQCILRQHSTSAGMAWSFSILVCVFLLTIVVEALYQIVSGRALSVAAKQSKNIALRAIETGQL